MMGAEPYQRALELGADVIVAGRASDCAIFAAMPVMKGFPEGLAWHAAKILECGAAAVVNRRTPDCMFAWLRKDHFVVQAPDETLRCTTQSSPRTASTRTPTRSSSSSARERSISPQAVTSSTARTR